MELSARRLWAPSAFILFSGAVYAFGLSIVARLPGWSDADLIAAALTLDLTVLVCAAYYLLLVRLRGWPVMSVVPIFLLSLAGASFVIPPQHTQMLTSLQWLIAPIELVIVGFVATQAWRTVRALRERGAGDQADFLIALRRSARRIFPSRIVADVVAFEAAIFYYALFSWRVKPSRGPGDFSHHQNCHYPVVLAGVGIAAGIELVAVHVLLQLWSVTAAWICTAVSLYGIVWIVGDFRAALLRPTRLTADSLLFRLGSRWSCDLRFDRIDRISRIDAVAADLKRDPDTFVAVLLGRPTHRLEFDGQIPVDGPYGIRKHVNSLEFNIDDPARFERVCAERGVELS